MTNALALQHNKKYEEVKKKNITVNLDTIIPMICWRSSER